MDIYLYFLPFDFFVGEWSSSLIFQSLDKYLARMSSPTVSLYNYGWCPESSFGIRGSLPQPSGNLVRGRHQKHKLGKFVDDTVLMRGASTNISMRFTNILDKFLSALRGYMSDNKCHIYRWNITRKKENIFREFEGLKLWETREISTA